MTLGGGVRGGAGAQQLQWAIGLAAVERFEESDGLSMGFWVGDNRRGC